MLTQRQQKLYDTFYTSTLDNQHLDKRTEILVGLAASMAVDCNPCTNYYLERAKNAGIPKDAISEVLAKIMTIASGQKWLEFKVVLQEYEVDLDSFESIPIEKELDTPCHENKAHEIKA